MWDCGIGGRGRKRNYGLSIVVVENLSLSFVSSPLVKYEKAVEKRFLGGYDFFRCNMVRDRISYKNPKFRKKHCAIFFSVQREVNIGAFFVGNCGVCRCGWCFNLLFLFNK